MNGLGEGIALAGLCLAAAALEIHGKSAGALWVLVFFWVTTSDFGQKS